MQILSTFKQKATLSAQEKAGRSSGPAWLEGGQRMLDRSTVSVLGPSIAERDDRRGERWMLCRCACYMIDVHRYVHDL